MRTIMPAFEAYPKEGSIIGRLVTGYGELEIDLAATVAEVLNDQNAAFKAVFRAPGEMGRIMVSDGLCRNKLPAGKTLTIFCEAIAAMHECRKIRNRYAHCQWWNEPGGLRFLALQESLEGNAHWSELSIDRHVVGLDVLKEQEEYFCYAQDCFLYVIQEVKKAAGRPLSIPESEAPQSRPKPRPHS